MNAVSTAACQNSISDLKEVSDIRNGIGFDLHRERFAHLPSRLKRATAEDLKECKYSREQVAERLSWLLGRKITLAQIDAVAAETKENRLPAEWIPAWTEATGSRRILTLLCEEAGFWLGDDTDRELAELGREGLKAQKAAKRVAELEAKLWHKPL